jgi:hypothetical protein
MTGMFAHVVRLGEIKGKFGKEEFIFEFSFIFSFTKAEFMISNTHQSYR